jgi:hypothetical protein
MSKTTNKFSPEVRERAINGELDDHLEGVAAAGKPNRRNGFSKKTGDYLKSCARGGFSLMRF